MLADPACELHVSSREDDLLAHSDTHSMPPGYRGHRENKRQRHAQHAVSACVTSRTQGSKKLSNDNQEKKPIHLQKLNAVIILHKYTHVCKMCIKTHQCVQMHACESCSRIVKLT